MKRGVFVIVLGPTGSGKSALIEHARTALPSLRFVSSNTTRQKRSALENQDYRFLTVEEFEKRKENGEFIEWAEYGGNYYGTLASEIETGIAEGALVMKEMEVQGIRQTLAKLPREEVKLIFIDVGSWENLERRVRARAPISEEELAKRKNRYEDEMTFKETADVIIANPDGKLEEAKEALVRALTDIQAKIDS